MNQADGVSDTVSLLCGTLWGRAQKRDYGHCLASGVLFRRMLSPSTCPDGRYFSFSLCATGVLPAAAPVLGLKESEPVYIVSLF